MVLLETIRKTEGEFLEGVADRSVKLSDLIYKRGNSSRFCSWFKWFSASTSAAERMVRLRSGLLPETEWYTEAF